MGVVIVMGVVVVEVVVEVVVVMVIVMAMMVMVVLVVDLKRATESTINTNTITSATHIPTKHTNI